MDRTRFLRTCTILAAGSFLAPRAGWAAAGGPQPQTKPRLWFRGDGDGRIFVSADQGITCKVHAKLGPHFIIHNFIYDNDETRVVLEYKRLQFQLRLTPEGRYRETL